MAKIRKSTVNGKSVYFATIAQAVKDVNFTDDDGKALTQAEINELLYNGHNEREESEKVVATALTDISERVENLDDKVDGKQDSVADLATIRSNASAGADHATTPHCDARHPQDKTAHITADERTKWNGKSDFSGSWNDLKDKPSTFTASAHTHDDRYYTKTDINSLYYQQETVDEMLSGKQDELTEAQMDAANSGIDSNMLEDINRHVGNEGNNHVSADERTKWNGKVDVYVVNIGFSPEGTPNMRHNDVVVTYEQIVAEAEAGKYIYFKVVDAQMNQRYEGFATWSYYGFNLYVAFLEAGVLKHAWTNVYDDSVPSHGIA